MPEDKLYYVYIVSSKSRAIYVGMTAFLVARVLKHVIPNRAVGSVRNLLCARKGGNTPSRKETAPA
jgi:hypothetical protein